MKLDWENFKQSNVARIFIAYAVVAFALMQVFDYLLPIIEAPLWVAQTLTLLLFLGFPISLLVGWVTQRPIVTSESGSQAKDTGYAHSLSRQKLILIGLGSSVLFGFLGLILMPYLLDQASFNRVGPESMASQTNSGSNYRAFRASMNLGVTGFRANHRTSTDIATSADGMTLAFLRHNQGAAVESELYIKDLTNPDASSERLLGGIDNGGGSGLMFFSEDNNWLHFIDGAKLARVRVEGGAFQTITNEINVLRSGYTTFEDKVIFSDSSDNQLYMIAGSGGAAEMLPIDEPGRVLTWPRLVQANAAKIIYTSSDSPQTVGIGSIKIVDLETGENRTIIETASNATYVDSGHVVFIRDSALWAVPFDADTMEVTGQEVPVVQGLETNSQLGHATYSVSKQGRLFYLPGTDGGLSRGNGQLSWLDRSGEAQSVEFSGSQYGHVRLSPDETMIAVTVYEPNGSADIWVWDVERKTLGRRTFEGKATRSIWTPDSERLIYSYGEEGIRTVLANGTQPAATILSTNASAIPTSVSPSSEIVFNMGAPPSVYILPPDVDTSAEVTAERLELAPSSSWPRPEATVSPDGNWLAYVSDETGTPHIYVRPFPDIVGGKWQISVIGGSQPIWNDNGTELFYWSGNHIQYSTPYSIGPISDNGRPNLIEFGVPEEVFNVIGLRSDSTVPAWDHSQALDRFLMIQPEGGVASSESLASQTDLVVVENWFEELRSLAPSEIN